MNDLISRSALLTDIESSVVFSGKPESASAEMRGANKIIDRIEAAPAVDAVEVVRCGECEYLEGGECVNPYLALNNEAHFYPDNDFFCADGERRDDET